MDNPGLMCDSHPRGDLAADRQSIIEGSHAISGQVRERLTGYILHGDDRHARRVIDRVDRAEVGVVQRRGREPRPAAVLGVTGQSGLKTFRATGRSSCRSRAR